MEAPLSAVLQAFDNSPSALAAAIGDGVKRQNIEYWIAVGRVPQAHRPAVERAMRGKVTCEQLSKEDRAPWVRIPDKSWPWHPKGRPLLDVARQAA